MDNYILPVDNFIIFSFIENKKSIIFGLDYLRFLAVILKRNCVNIMEIALTTYSFKNKEIEKEKSSVKK